MILRSSRALIELPSAREAGAAISLIHLDNVTTSETGRLDYLDLRVLLGEFALEVRERERWTRLADGRGAGIVGRRPVVLELAAVFSLSVIVWRADEEGIEDFGA